MNTGLPTAALLILVAPAIAGATPASKQVPVTTCWYNAQRKLTGTEAAPPGAKAGTTMQTPAGGVHSWSYTIAGTDASLCPSKLPISTTATS